MRSTNQGSIISVRTSDAHFQIVSSGWGNPSAIIQQPSVFHRHDNNRADTWNHIALPITMPSGQTTSFTSIHQDVTQELDYHRLTTETPSGPRRSRGDNPGGNAVGDATVPVGDALLPLLAIATAYIIHKLFRNRKASHTL